MPSSKSDPIPNTSTESPAETADTRLDWEERFREADIPRRKRPSKRVHRVSFLTLFLTCIACLVSVLLIFSYTRLTVLNDRIAKEKEHLVTLQNECVKLNAEYESRYDLSQIELYAQTELGMTKMDNSQVEYVEIGIPDTITRVTDEHFTFSVLGDALVSLINSVLALFS